ncbi:MAG: immunity 50 family protein [Candidatus Omnitrophica bacterium]|nr:immunity 50 family protein [Candidatus Omnitrophota bacterium]
MCIEFIKNSTPVVEYFGKWPSFHDAEITKIEINREGILLKILFYLFIMSKNIDSRGHYVLEKKSYIEMQFSGIEELKLFDFNVQNVIAGLIIKSAAGGKKYIEIEPCYGLYGSFMCRDIEVMRIVKT